MEEILRPEQLIPIAARQGLSLSEAEAKLLLGYMEGHDYVLLSDAQGQMVRHDLQMGDDHSEDCLYTIGDVISFAVEMNTDLLCIQESVTEPDGSYLSDLRKNDCILASLLDKIPGGWCV